MALCQLPPPLFVPDIENGHLIISGTGRSGTTLLVQIFTFLELDTGFTPDEVLQKVDSISAAGLEHQFRTVNKPYILKSPWLSDDIETAIAEGMCIDCVIIPMRDLFAAAESRRRVYEENVSQGLGPAKAAHSPGSLWKVEAPEEQENVLTTQFYKLLDPLILNNIPVIFLHFPRFAKDYEYFYKQLQPIFDTFSISKQMVQDAFNQVVDLSLIHEF